MQPVSLDLVDFKRKMLALTTLVTEPAWHFTPEGLIVAGIDPANVAGVMVRIPKIVSEEDVFHSYNVCKIYESLEALNHQVPYSHCDRVSVSVRETPTIELILDEDCNLITTVNVDDSTFYFKYSPSGKNLKDDSPRVKRHLWLVKGLNYPDHLNNMPAIVEVSGLVFKKMVNVAASQYSDQIYFKAWKDNFTATTEDGWHEFHVRGRVRQSVEETQTALYSVEYLQEFARAVMDRDVVTLRFGTDYLLRMGVNDDIFFLLAPRRVA